MNLLKLMLGKRMRPQSRGRNMEIKEDMPPAAAGNRLSCSAAGRTHQGMVRGNNEDSFYISPGAQEKGAEGPFMFAVADGMGGENHGEVASFTALDALEKEFGSLHRKYWRDFDYGEWLKTAVRKANLALIGEAARLKTYGSMGSTLVAVLVAGGKAFVANVGDSRAYLCRSNDLHQVTRDHSLVYVMAEKGLIKAEDIYTHPRRGELLRFMGQNEEVEADMFEIDLYAGDYLVLCSDGLWEMVRDPDIYSILNSCTDVTDACGMLVETANQAGGLDNITIIVMKVA